MIDAGHADRLDRFVPPWVIKMCALYADVVLDGGGILPWRAGALEDQPYRELLALRLLRAEWSRRHNARMDRKK